MPSLTCFNFRFTPHWLMIVLAAVFIALFIRLGFWQIHRADEKKKMVASEASQALQAPILWDAQQKLPDQYQRIQLEGHFLAPMFLLDNQHQQHQFGYDVISPLILADGSVLMVDRGWVIGDPTRRSFPEIQTTKALITLQGYAYFPSPNRWVLGQGFEKKTNQMTIIEQSDFKLFSQLLQKKVYPFIMRLDKQDPAGFVREWAIVSMPPERHLAYALQWFAMALVILILFVALNLKKIDEKK